MKRTRIVGSNSTNKEGERYILGLDDYFNYHRIYEKTNELYERRHQIKNSANKVKTELDKLNELITNCNIKAEKKFCKKKLQRKNKSTPRSNIGIL
jgi:hypothetical protein